MWMNKKILAKLKHERGSIQGVKLGEVAWKEYRDIIQACRDMIREAKSLLGLNLRFSEIHQRQQKGLL